MTLSKLAPAFEALAAFGDGRLRLLFRALSLLAPVIDDFVDWLAGDADEPPYLRELPARMQARLTLERVRLQAAKKASPP